MEDHTTETVSIPLSRPASDGAPVPFKIRTNDQIKAKFVDAEPKKEKQIAAAIEKVYNAIKESVVGQQITAGRVVIIVSRAMEVAGTFTALAGSDKKTIVKNLIRRVVMEEASFANSEEREATIALLNLALSPTIDMLWKAFAHAVDYGTKKAKKCAEACGCL